MPIDLAKQDLDGEHPTPCERAMLEALQFNVLRGHGRRHVRLLGLTIESARAGRAAIADLAGQVTSMQAQLQARRARAQAPTTAIPPFVSVLLSASAYEALERSPFAPDDASFRRGSPPRVLCLAAGDDPATVEDAVQELDARIDGRLSFELEERGARLEDAQGLWVEHFGFVDGLSQPTFLREDARTEDEHGTRRWDPRAPLGAVLTRDPGSPDEDHHGSYVVFRKIEQDVHAFAAAERLAARPRDVRGAAAARWVGRHRDGTPLVVSPRPVGNATNDFDYRGDATGRACPRSAHVRVTNPRSRERPPPLPRRGVPYGTCPGLPPGRPAITLPPELQPRGGVGLLFLAYVGSVTEQFDPIARAMDAEDALVGGKFVRTLAEEILFAPSIPTLRAFRGTRLAKP